MFPRNPFSCRRSVLRLNSRLGVAGVVALFLFFIAAHMAFTALVPLSWREADLSHVVRVIAERQNFPVDQIDAEAKRDIMRKLFGASYDSNESLPSAFAKNLSDALNRYPTPSPNKYYPEYFKKLATLKSEAVTEKSLLSVANKLESFRPILSWKEKADLLHAFDAFALACETAGLTYFLLEASLMGVRRHHGMIPWDDDIDIVVNTSQWTELYTVLSDIPGFELFASKDAQWKFYVSSAKQFKDKPFKFPYLDIFFFSEDDQYIWAGVATGGKLPGKLGLFAHKRGKGDASGYGLGPHSLQSGCGGHHYGTLPERQAKQPNSEMIKVYLI
nr:hypothetical protein BaRGS_026736 [Batillaria attramentaria]